MPKRKEIDLGRIALHDNGFGAYDSSDCRWSLSWDDVVWIAVFKRDEYTTDLVCMQVVADSGDDEKPFLFYEVHEEQQGFSELVRQIEQVFPSSKKDWEPSIWAPAFAQRFTVIYSRRPCTLLIAADPREVGSLPDGTHLDLELRWPGLMVVGQSLTFIAVNGAGIENARVAVERGFERFPIGAIVSVGYVGALDAALNVGQVFVARHVTRLDSAVKYAVEIPRFADTEGVAEGTLLTIDRVAQTQAEKLVLRESGADAVDMEAYAVAEEAERRGVPFYCVRVVSDGAVADFPVDFNRARRPDGTFSGWRVLAQAGLRPGRWKRLLALKRDADLASQCLADFLSTCRFDAHHR